MIYVVEPICRGQVHVPFCAAFLKSLQEAFPMTAIVYLGSESQVINVKEFLLIHDIDVSNITFDCVESFEKLNRTYLEPFKTLKEINRVTRLKNVEYVFISTASLQDLYFLYLSRLFFRPTPVYAVLHRATTQLKSQKWSVNISARFLCSRNYAKRFIYPIVLSEDVKRETKKYSYSFHNQLKYINHPYIFNFNAEPRAVAEIPKVGFLGLGSKNRGYDTFLKIAESSSGYADFYGIGMLGSDLRTINQSCLKAPMPENHLSRKDYIDLLTKMDFIIMPFQDDYYTLAVSGALFDALMFGKPILFLHGIFSKLLIQKYGEIGISFETGDDITFFLKNNHWKYDYEKIRHYQRMCLNNFTTTYVSRQIIEIINENSINNHKCRAI